MVCAFEFDEFNQVWNWETVKQIWHFLEVNQVNESKIDLITHEYETISDMSSSSQIL